MRCQIGSVVRPKPGNRVSGDAWLHLTVEAGELVGLCDGLGSGELARQAADAFVRSIEQAPSADLDTLLARCHTALLGTRGVAAALLLIEPASQQVSYAGIGNVEVRSRRSWDFHPLSLRGIVGANVYRSPRIYRAQYPPSEWIVLHSDGLRARFDLEYELLRASGSADPDGVAQVLAEALAAGHGRETDDLTVLAVRLP